MAFAIMRRQLGSSGEELGKDAPLIGLRTRAEAVAQIEEWYALTRSTGTTKNALGVVPGQRQAIQAHD